MGGNHWDKKTKKNLVMRRKTGKRKRKGEDGRKIQKSEQKRKVAKKEESKEGVKGRDRDGDKKNEV